MDARGSRDDARELTARGRRTGPIGDLAVRTDPKKKMKSPSKRNPGEPRKG